MEIELRNITVADLVDGYRDDGDGGVVGYNGELDIRPEFQREFVYKGDQRDAVIDTINKGYPLNVMYWAKREEGGYEIIDGQQRTISICQYATNTFSVEGIFSDYPERFVNLSTEQQNRVLDYELTVYVCDGSRDEKLEWFKTINIAGVKLTDQELRNAVYSGPWVSDAKRYFSRANCDGEDKGKDYVSGIVKRQDYLETAIRWASHNNIEEYMSAHKEDSSAKPLWEHFEKVVDWIETTFTVKRPEMKGLDWGAMFDSHKDDPLDPVAVEEEARALFADDEVEKRKGIYQYILTRDEKHLNLRKFPDDIRLRVYGKQGGKCAECGQVFDVSRMEADHIKPWSEGGKTVEENCQMLCKMHNRRKGAR